MRAVICREYGPPELLQIAEVPAPAPGDGEVLIDVRAAAVNFPDLLIIQNRYQLSVAPPFTPGSELAGIVRAVGSGVSGIAVGDRVCGQPLVGAYAEQALLPAVMITRLPESVDFNLLLLKGCQLLGFNLAPFMMNAPDQAARYRQELFDLLVSRRINPYVSAVYGLSDVARALNDVGERRVIGKVIIDPSA